MPDFILQFGSREAPSDEGPVVLDATCLDDAKLEAAMLYAGTTFKSAAPTSFLILHEGAIVYRFPEG
jgi:hypothetical protein